ncbi:MAG: IS66 family insertion sequence element accessory protein TnpA [Verrucomicrobiota bacterium]
MLCFVMDPTEDAMKQRTRRGREEWKRRIDEQARSGLSAKRFCERESIELSSFYKWRSHLSTSEGLARAADEESPFIDMGRIVGEVAGGVPGGVPGGEGAKSGWEITLDLGDGIRLALRRG